jgi:cyclase
VVVAVDARRRAGPDGTVPSWEVFTHGGRTATGLDALRWCEEIAAIGAGEILLTSMDRDGTRDGFDLELTALVSDRCPVPVIASGGVGNLDHLVEGARDGHAEAVLAASIFHLGEFTVAEAKEHLAAAGVVIRPVDTGAPDRVDSALR